MKTINITLYKFDELDSTAQEKAIHHFFDINVDHEWWDAIYEDAENIGLKINEFDLDRAQNIRGEFMTLPIEVAQNIILTHGIMCETYKLAGAFIREYGLLVGICGDEKNEEATVNLETDFLHDLCAEYRIMLEEEYDYLTSEKAIIETIIASNYDFLVNGSVYL